MMAKDSDGDREWALVLVALVMVVGAMVVLVAGIMKAMP